MVTEEHVSTLARYRSNRGRRGRGTNVLSCWLSTSCYLVRYSIALCSLTMCAVLPCWPLLSSCLVSLSFAIHSLSSLGRAGRTLGNAQFNLVFIILCARAGVLAYSCSRARGAPSFSSWRLGPSWPRLCSTGRDTGASRAP